MCGFAAAGLVLSAIGTAASISQGQQQAKTQRAAYERQAQVAETQGALQKEDLARQQAKILGQQRALYGASGVDPFVGSASDVQANTQADFARQGYMQDFNTQNSVSAFNASAANSQANYGPSLFQFGSTVLDYSARKANRG